MNIRQEYEIITFDEFKSREDGGFYLLYWTDTGRYYGGRALDYSRRKHESTIGRDNYLNRHWKTHGPPDIVIVVPLREYHFAFEQAWIDVFRGGFLYDKTVCLNTSKRADVPTPTREQCIKAYEQGIGSIPLKEMNKYRKKGIATQIKNSIGVHGFTPEQRIKNGKKSAAACKKNGVGIFSLTPEQLIERGRNIPREASVKGGQVQGHRNKESGRMAEIGRKYGAINARKRRVLTPAQIHEILHLLALGDMSQSEIAEYYPVRQTAISRINLGKTYVDL